DARALPSLPSRRSSELSSTDNFKFASAVSAAATDINTKFTGVTVNAMRTSVSYSQIIDCNGVLRLAGTELLLRIILRGLTALLRSEEHTSELQSRENLV